MRHIAAIVTISVVVLLAVQCRADIVILKNGKRYKGELNHRSILLLNPLKPETITILLEAGGTREEKLVSFNAHDVAIIIVELEKGREVINLEELRKLRFEKQEKQSPPSGSPPTDSPAQLPPDDPRRTDLKPDHDPDTNKSMRRNLAFVGGGFLTLCVGSLAGTGEDGGLNTINYFLIGAGAAAICYGVYRLLKSTPARSGASKPDGAHAPNGLGIRLGVQTHGAVSLSIEARF